MSDARPLDFDPSSLGELLDRLDVGVFRVDHASARITWANDACARVVGLSSAARMIGMHATDFYVDPKERTEIEARLMASESFRKSGVARLDVRRLSHDTREPIDVVLGVSASFDPTGRISDMWCTIERTATRRLSEKAFQASEERFRTVFDTAGVGMVLTDVTGNIYRANAALCRMMGRDEAELLGTNALDLEHPDDRIALPSFETHPHGSPGREVRVVRRDGSIGVCVVSWSWLLDDEGRPHSVVAALQDISALRQSELRLQQLAKFESLGVLAGGIAHDFNNILAVIMGNLSLAQRLPDAGPKTREALALAEAASVRARDLAQQLVAFAKGGSPAKRTASIATLVREAAGFYLRGSNVAVSFSLLPDLWLSDVDSSQIGQVLQNLFINAVQAMPDGGTVHVDAENVELTTASGIPLPPGRYVRVRVHDEGVGIPRENLERVFDPYFSTKEGGTGLGLAMAHSIVLRHGGHLSVASAPLRGTTFSIYLAASESRVAATAGEHSSTEPLPAARVLVMDDEPGVRLIAQKMLAARGLDVDVAADGDRALALYTEAIASRRPYSVVVLDLTVPGGLGGVETLRRLRDVDPAVRAIVSTGHSSDPVLADCRAHGFAAAVSKPYTLAELEAAVRDVIAAG